MKARINNELVPVFQLIDIDIADNRAYVKTWAGSEVFCVPTWDVIVEKADYDKQEIDLGTHTGILGGDVFEFGSKEWFDNINPLPY